MSPYQPLAERMRPKTFDDYFGQEHLTDKEAVFRKLVESGNINSFILWGPPGVGKTTLAGIIAQMQDRPFYTLSAVSSGVKDVRETIERAQKSRMFNQRNPILFIDEIHRFNKAQQDSLLSAVEKGIITLIGATTENPSFEVISPLLSRCQVYVLKALSKDDLSKVTNRVIKEDSELKKRKIEIKENEAMFRYSGGDARKLLNIIEMVVNAVDSESVQITNEVVVKNVQEKMAMYDKSGEQHYDIISAFIKSVRGSDPNAAVYWLSRMVEGGEDPKFIARRLVILAAEDIGLANPNALMLATSGFEAVNMIGWPESRIILSEVTIYLATSPKSNASYKAINDALALVKSSGDLSVPLHIRNAPTDLMNELGYGKGYKYAHDYPDNFIQEEFLPDEIKNTILYYPQKNAREEEIRKRLEKIWKSKYDYK